MSEEIRDSIPDRINPSRLVDDIMKALDQSAEAAYLLYLKLAIRYGAGQKI